jgi:CRISPR-associated protein Csb1
MLVNGCADDSFDAGLTIRSELSPLAGPGAPVKPSSYEGGQYQRDRRWLNGAAVDAIVIDNVPSEANRLEAALAVLRPRLGLPDLVLDLSGVDLPAHLPTTMSSFLFPHRNGDAYLRDAAIGDVQFMRTETGRAVFDASADNPEGLFKWMPQALLFGFWQSHLGKKKQQTKHARCWTSEIVGYQPATHEVPAGEEPPQFKTLGVKGDPLNLSIDEAVEYDDKDHATWKLTGEGKTGKTDGKDRNKERLSEIGHGQVLAGGALAPVSFAQIVQQATCSFAGLRRVRTVAEGRAVLAAIGIVGHVAAFGRAFNLRSSCDLRPSSTTWTWLGDSGDIEVDAPTLDEAVALLAGCAAAAEAKGLPVGSKWPAPLMLTPQARLAEVIGKSWPQLDQSDEAAA